MYYSRDGQELSREEIARAVKEKRAILRWQHGNWKNYATLVICQTAEDADIESERDTRGECWSMSEEVWSDYPCTIREALKAASGSLSYS